MKICRFDDDRLGLVLGNYVLDVTAALDAIPNLRWPLPPGDLLIMYWDAIAKHIDLVMRTAPKIPLEQIALRCPITNPSKIIGIARNRRNLAAETIDIGGASINQRRDNDPIQMFIKAPSSLAGPSDGFIPRFPDRRTDPEAELTIIIGKPGTNIPTKISLEHVFGYCIGLDMTLRGQESPSSRKSIDTYAILGPWIVTADEVPDPDQLDMHFTLNGALVQKSNTRDLAFGMAEIVSHASRFYTLHAGDVIMAGTPIGFEPIKPGDTMRAEYSKIGVLETIVHDFAF
jgi:2,4-didehydro-3-deoxy-L-rhamnonate hydrolase